MLLVANAEAEPTKKNLQNNHADVSPVVGASVFSPIGVAVGYWATSRSTGEGVGSSSSRITVNCK